MSGGLPVTRPLWRMVWRFPKKVGFQHLAVLSGGLSAEMMAAIRQFSQTKHSRKRDMRLHHHLCNSSAKGHNAG